MKIYFPLLLLLAVISTSCSDAENNATYSGYIDSVNVTQIESPASVCIGTDAIYVYDLFQNTVFKVKDGIMVDSLFNIGEGPGEYRNVSDMGFQNNHLFIMDRALMRITEFTENFSFVSAVSLNYPPNSMLITEKSIFVTTSVSEFLIYEYNHTGEQINTYIANSLKGDMTSAISNILNLAYSEEKLYGGYLTRNEIIEIDLKTNGITTYQYEANNPHKKAEVVQNGNRMTSCTGTVYCSDIIIKDSSLIFLSGGGFTGTQEGRIPIDDMNYYIVTAKLPLTDSGFEVSGINLPRDDMLGYKINIIDSERFLITSPAKNNLYIINY